MLPLLFIYYFFVNLFYKWPKLKMTDNINDKKYKNPLACTLLTTYRNTKMLTSSIRQGEHHLNSIRKCKYFDIMSTHVYIFPFLSCWGNLYSRVIFTIPKLWSLFLYYYYRKIHFTNIVYRIVCITIIS